MAGKWQTHRGDEWWYSDGLCEVEASASDAYPLSLLIETIQVKTGLLSADQLHRILVATQSELPDLQIWIAMQPQIRAALDTLKEKGLVEWRILRQPLSEQAVVEWVMSKL